MNGYSWQAISLCMLVGLDENPLRKAVSAGPNSAASVNFFELSSLLGLIDFLQILTLNSHSILNSLI